jgi:hypothetical protein
MTIVGLEKLQSGARNLLVFDPMFHDAPSITRLVDRQFQYRFPDMALKAYRRGHKYLRRFREFEILKFVHPSRVTRRTTPKGSVDGIWLTASLIFRLREPPGGFIP